MNKTLGTIMLLLLLSIQVHAEAGQLEGEKVLDSSQNYATNAFREGLEGLSFLPGGVLYYNIISTLTNSFSVQHQNKEQGLSQNTELDVAKQNLENSKDNITTMFFFIVSTLVVLFDALLSVIYISLFLLIVWIVFVGYVKVLVVLINFIYGKFEKRNGK